MIGILLQLVPYPAKQILRASYPARLVLVGYG